MTTTLQELDEVLALREEAVAARDARDHEHAEAMFMRAACAAHSLVANHSDTLRRALAALELQAKIDDLARIGELLRTQDNRATDQPIFIVQQKRWIHGVELDYNNSERVWIHHERESYELTDETEIARLDDEYDEHYTVPEGYTLTGKMHVWEFVTACFTEQGCKDFITRNGHNLAEPRIYAEGSYRNEEWRTVRDFIAALPAPPAGGQDDAR